MKTCYFIEPFKKLRNAISGKAGTEHFLKPGSLYSDMDQLQNHKKSV